ncbi:glycosyltransferase family 2 protein [Candidatus Saccharibacteria bacterium]|nr:glycosyltransferase family 2 protein [Candidatus Saccharibacteria bacterium]
MPTSLTIICPIYNASKFIDKLHSSLLSQKKVNIKEIKYILTESKDETEKFLEENNIRYTKIKKAEFSHSLTREKTALESSSDVIVFITQDIVIEDNLWLYNLTKDIKGDIVATYSRQLTKYNNIEKYTRESNYPAKSIIKSKGDIKKLGLKTFFFSDAASAIDTKTFKKLNGYDHKNLPISEDMYIAHKIIMDNKKIKYCANSVVYHSHNFTLKQLYDRYKLTGKFFKENSYLNEYGTTNSGANLAKYILRRLIQEKRFLLLLRYPFDMSARLFGMKAGQR